MLGLCRASHSRRIPVATAVWKGHLTFGLVSIPIRLHRAARAEKISFRQLHRTYAPAIEAARPQRGRPAPTPLFEPPPPASAKTQRLNESAALEMPSRRNTRDEGRTPPPPVETVSRVQQRLVSDAADEPIERAELV